MKGQHHELKEVEIAAPVRVGQIHRVLKLGKKGDGPGVLHFRKSLDDFMQLQSPVPVGVEIAEVVLKRGKSLLQHVDSKAAWLSARQTRLLEPPPKHRASVGPFYVEAA